MRAHRLLLIAGCAVGLALLPALAGAQSSTSPAPPPTVADEREPIRLLVGMPPGSGVDEISRVLAQGLSERLFRPVRVENRTGARGNVAGEELARSIPDGNTLGVVTATTMLLNRHLSRHLGYDPQADLTPISRFASLPFLVLTGPGSDDRTVGDLIENLKARPGTCGTPGAGSAQHLALELLMRSAGARCDFVHFRGIAGALPELLNGSVQVYVEAAVIGLPLVREGRVRLLAVTSRARSALLPETPTVAETVAGYEAETWLALMGPRGLASTVLSKLEAAAIAVARDAAVVNRLRALSAEPIGGTRIELATTIRAQDSIWGPVARAAGVTAD
ncbi:Bug family tripartite tricarboxylate transporter substrate binding protein [Roseococcus pinisoli]|uniref:Tripartite tricarboxylate transporter substrate binding protein n=1 Tax=Roseococcus pinisoli TaxID=2835040 RepID=A0ABS5QIU3_9PROT|nr:tripartite tricarboxylate transporter substrate binding protein [Roseococcus pinisoli]MBS7813534.1 tripartite tricarboxylate transporter substrate binding protein [Roseococcus pinisoli]